MPTQHEWQARLTQAISTDDVLGAIRDFLSEWTPEDIDELPAECRPGHMSDVDDVAIYALTLAQKQCTAVEVAPRLQVMADFFIAASQRISQLLAQAAHRTATTSVRV